MRLFLLPISTRRTLIYCERVQEQLQGAKTPLQERIINKASTTWASWEKAEKGWQKQVTVYGNSLFKRIPPEGILHDRIVGCATDGALVGMVLIDTTLWRRLSWLQRLIEWSPVLSPHAQQTPTYDRMGSELSGITNPERGLPIGLKSRSTDDLVLLQPRIRKENDLHIDGDVLARVLESPGAVREVRNVMSILASETERPVGRWMMEHLDEEMEALEGVVELVRRLERWMA